MNRFFITICSSLVVTITVFILGFVYAEVYPYYSQNDYNRILDYCWDHADRAAKGENVLTDLVNASFIPSWFDNKTCLDVNDELTEYLNLHGINR